MDVVMDEAFCSRVGLYRKPLGPKYGWSRQQQCREPDCGAANHDSLEPTAITGIRACWGRTKERDSMRSCASYRISFDSYQSGLRFHSKTEAVAKALRECLLQRSSRRAGAYIITRPLADLRPSHG